jgi:hypothetical protein
VASVKALRAAVADYQAGGGPAALSRLANEADIASSTLARMAKRMAGMSLARIPDATPIATEPGLDIDKVHAWTRNAMVAVQHGLCARCGGIAHPQ